MIQDMMETEYFTTDSSSTMSNSSSIHSNISERTPMMLVTIPIKHHYKITNGHATNRQTHGTTYPSKRMRMDETAIAGTSNAVDGFQVYAPAAQDDIGRTDSIPTIVANFYLDHYPNAVNTTTNHNNEDDHHRPLALQLNQMVEILGIIDDTELDDDSEESTAMVSDDDKMEEDKAETKEPHGNRYYHDDDACLFPDEDGALTTENTTRSSTPRLHVLWYRIVNLDDVEDSRSSSAGSSAIVPKPLSPIPAVALFQAWMNCGYFNSSVTTTTTTNNNAKCHADWQALAQALWIVLHSKAEQPSSQSTTVNNIKPMLGCASLNVVVPVSVNSSDNDAITSLLIHSVETLVHPHCCHVITLDDCSSTLVLDQLQSPQKLFGRMKSSALQLPAGSTLMIDVRQYSGGGRDTTDTHHDDTMTNVANYENPNHPLYALRHICRYFQLPYKFDGGIEIPFLADYRVIVLSNPSTQHLIPCTVSIPVPIQQASPSWTTTPAIEQLHDSPILLQLRDTLRKNRSSMASTAIRLHDAVIERAQQDFCDRRRQFYDGNNSQTNGNVSNEAMIPTMPKILMGEQDFHRWLILCRLMARGRDNITNIAELMDWEQAIRFDDAVRNMMHEYIK